MKIRALRVVGIAGGVVAAASLGYVVYKTGRRGSQVQVEQDFKVPAWEVIDLIRQVDKEPEFVPFVSRVEIFDRQNDEVTYEVTSDVPVPWRVVYKKWWDYAQKWVAWKSLIGTLGVVHTGEIRFEETLTGCRATLISNHRFTVPVAGGSITLFSEHYVRAAMTGWMKRLAEELESRKELMKAAG